LQSNAVFVVEAEYELWTWTGRSAIAEDRKLAYLLVEVWEGGGERRGEEGRGGERRGEVERGGERRREEGRGGEEERGDAVVVEAKYERWTWTGRSATAEDRKLAYLLVEVWERE
jgi:hypothetical protein